ncbi:hypothetical protein [Autumnicola edwardsiae]|uniref:Uncharacterized protein n=1 Tax=Autumnicola edwardsiae TaxID=3075594 RepID=A0ABU3CXN1_9FLAO|nr:hypothetical protein [Zunongwangia sp. F297]MDT0651026.1 hypothetical protein [Zunongwangia sp. F297]
MGIKDFFQKLKGEKKVMKGEATKDKTYSSENEFSTREETKQEFKRSVSKLFDVNQWTRMPGISSSFTLYSATGTKKKSKKPEMYDFIKIVLPGPVPENWVLVTDIKEKDNLAEFTVSPSKDPEERDKEQEIEHFFAEEASSTFRVEMRDRKIKASEIGKNEGINNQDHKAGQRVFVNTIVAEAGWAGVQKFQWKKLTDFLVHKIEIEEQEK